MLMAWGPFRFTVPNYSVETTRRSIQPRVAPQDIIGSAPTLHRLGPGNVGIGTAKWKWSKPLKSCAAPDPRVAGPRPGRT